MFGQMSKQGNLRHKWDGSGEGKCVKCGLKLRKVDGKGAHKGEQRQVQSKGEKSWTALAPKEALPDCVAT
jgi:hypothetical protein